MNAPDLQVIFTPLYSVTLPRNAHDTKAQCHHDLLIQMHYSPLRRHCTQRQSKFGVQSIILQISCALGYVGTICDFRTVQWLSAVYNDKTSIEYFSDGEDGALVAGETIVAFGEEQKVEMMDHIVELAQERYNCDFQLVDSTLRKVRGGDRGDGPL